MTATFGGNLLIRIGRNSAAHPWNDLNIVADVEGNSVTVYFRGVNLIYADDGSKTYYHFNAHGDVVVLTNASGKDITVSSMANAVLTGAVCGALGGAIGSISLATATATLVAKGVASVAVGTVMGNKTGIESEGTTQQRVATGIVTGVLTAGSTFLGSQIDTSGFGFAGSAFTNYSTTLFVGTFAEMGAVAAQQTIDSLGSKSSEIRAPHHSKFSQVCIY